MVKAGNKKDRKVEINFFSSFIFKIILLLGIIALFFIFYKLSGQIYKQRTINQEIVVLQDEIDRLNQDNGNLKEIVAYFQTDQYKEKETKEKLGLIREGEEVIEIKEREFLVKGEVKDEKPQVRINRPNYYYWWHYFFNINS